MRIDVVRYDHPDAAKLIDELQADYLVRYGGPDETPVDPDEFAPPRGLFLVGYVDDEPVACGGWRSMGEDVEVKRMFVTPPWRRRGLAKKVLTELERAAAEAGYKRVLLMTGERQPEAIALYQAYGYSVVPGFGYYADEPQARHLGKDLTTGPRADG